MLKKTVLVVFLPAVYMEITKTNSNLHFFILKIKVGSEIANVHHGGPVFKI